MLESSGEIWGGRFGDGWRVRDGWEIGGRIVDVRGGNYSGSFFKFVLQHLLSLFTTVFIELLQVKFKETYFHR